MRLLEMTLKGGVMALVIMALRTFLLYKLPKRTFIILWEIAMLRLVLPVSIPAAASVCALFPRLNRPSVTARVVASVPMLPDAARMVWLAGMAVAAAAFAAGYGIVYRRYRCAAIVRGGFTEEWMQEQKIRRSVRIRRSEQTVSPLTYGILRPTILLPEGLENRRSEQLTCILTHEMTHIRRFDMLRKIAAAAVLCVHWFNPAVWVLFRLYNRDMELACDEAVVREMKGDCRSVYAMTLIGMEEKRRGFSSLYSYFSKNAMEERIVAIMKTTKRGAASAIAALTLILIVACGFAASAVTADRSVDAAIPANAHQKDDEQKPFLRYIFDDDAMREASEDEFAAFVEKRDSGT